MSTTTVLDSTTLADLRGLVTSATRRNLQLAERLQRAAAIVIADQIEAHADGTFSVMGSAEHPYTVLPAVSCTCPDYQTGKAPTTDSGQAWCKHLLAVGLVLQLARLAARRGAQMADWRDLGRRRQAGQPIGQAYRALAWAV